MFIVLCMSAVCFAADYNHSERLAALAQSNNREFIQSIVEGLRNYENHDYILMPNLLISGSQHSGKRSLAYEIAQASGRAYSENHLENFDTFPTYMNQLLEITDPHVAIFHNVQNVQANAFFNVKREECARKRNLFLIGLCDEQFNDKDLADGFYSSIHLSRPNVASRQAILNHYWQQENIGQDLITYAAQRSETIHAGALALLAQELIQQEGPLTQAKIDSALVPIVGQQPMIQPQSSFMDGLFNVVGVVVDISGEIMIGAIVAGLEYKIAKDTSKKLKELNEEQDDELKIRNRSDVIRADAEQSTKKYRMLGSIGVLSFILYKHLKSNQNLS